MKKNLSLTIILLAAVIVLSGFLFLFLRADCLFKENKNMAISEEIIKLPEPRKDSDFSLERAINERRSVRSYTAEKISLAEISQLLWASQGLTSETKRAAPSAGALYPMEIYAVGAFGDYEAGIYHYQPQSHSLARLKSGDFRPVLSEIGLSQRWIEKAPLNLVVTGVVSRTAAKYGERAGQYVALEAGHVGQNIYLQAEALGLGTVAVGAFDDEQMAELFSFEESQKAYYIFPVGHK